MSAIRAERLTARYPAQAPGILALSEMSLEVRRGERLLLLGPNGAGKSTFIRIFAGLMRETAGTASILGQAARRARHLVGVVGHATYLYEELAAEENLRLYGELYGVPDPRRRAVELLDRVGLLDLAREHVGRMSRGQQQRVALARALVHDPPVLLLDEPDTGLDLGAFQLMEDLALRNGRTVVLTTHNLAAGLRLGSRVAVLARGRVVHEQDGVSMQDGEHLAGLLRQLATRAAGAA
jgi:ABC-type multidrug transport system ATPase subunit